MRRQFVNNEICHIYNRGVEKRNIFEEPPDYFRFIHNLFEFNDEAPAALYRYKAPLSHGPSNQCYEVSPHNVKATKPQRKPRKLLVEILCWCLMPNHFHLLLRQVADNGISLFMQKLGTGYTMYFNQKYERSGVLFQGCFKAVLVKNEKHFLYLPFYIHCNALDLIEPAWREGKIDNFKKAMEFLKNFRYSSNLDYIGEKNFPSVSQKEFILDIFGGTENYKKQQQDWLKDMGETKLEILNAVILD